MALPSRVSFFGQANRWLGRLPAKRAYLPSIEALISGELRVLRPENWTLRPARTRPGAAAEGDCAQALRRRRAPQAPHDAPWRAPRAVPAYPRRMLPRGPTAMSAKRARRAPRRALSGDASRTGPIQQRPAGRAARRAPSADA